MSAASWRTYVPFEQRTEIAARCVPSSNPFTSRRWIVTRRGGGATASPRRMRA